VSAFRCELLYAEWALLPGLAAQAEVLAKHPLCLPLQKAAGERLA